MARRCTKDGWRRNDPPGGSARRELRAVGSLLFAALVLAVPVAAQAEALPTVADTLRGTPFSPRDAKTVLAGKIAITTVDEPSDRELVVGLACLMPETAPEGNPFAADQPMLPDALMDRAVPLEPDRMLETLENVEVTPEGVKELRRYLEFEPGLGLNLSSEEADAFRRMQEGSTPGVDDIQREVARQLVERVDRYKASGLPGIAPYLREKGKLAEPDDELRRALHQAHTMEKRYPDFFEYWNRFPDKELEGVGERFFWIRTPIRDRRAFVLAHLAAWRQGDTHMVGERHFYISHFFNGGYTVAFVIPVQEGRLFAMMERLWIDGYSGMAGIKRRFGRKMIADNLKDESLQRKACAGR